MHIKQNPTNRWVSLLAVSGVFLLTATAVFAQDGEEAERVTLFDQIVESGVWMYPLYLCSIIMVALYVFNSMQLTRAKFCPPILEAALLEHMQACRARSAIEVAAQSPTYLGRMAAHSLPHVDATDPETLGKEKVEDAMAEFSVRENRGYMTLIGYFSLIAQSAPMIGLLGTVAGMIGAFATLRQTGGADPSALAGDISTALLTTAGGLVIALPSLFGYFFFKNRLNKLVADCHIAEVGMLDASINTVNADQQLARVPEGLHE
jgi:biopolymer transport protein ExbB